eukprot:2504483-Rhodomonas_salina.1
MAYPVACRSAARFDWPCWWKANPNLMVLCRSPQPPSQPSRQSSRPVQFCTELDVRLAHGPGLIVGDKAEKPMNDFEVEVMVQTATTQKKRKRILATTEDMFEEELAGLSDSNDEDAPGPSVTQVKAQAEPGQGAHSKVKAEKSAVDKAAGPKKGGQSALAACG